MYGHLSDILRILTNGQKLDLFASIYHVTIYLCKCMMYKVKKSNFTKNIPPTIEKISRHLRGQYIIE